MTNVITFALLVENRGNGGASLKQKIEHSLDIRTTIQPLSLLKASQAFRNMGEGETMEILLRDPVIREYIFKVLPAALCELIEITEDETCCHVYVRKKHDEA